ncbi:hypothetical protein EWI07_12880 [Sporolactobacillus sp. THM7-4]|nr:hypothetical protein EWI07_12880 [Sporolactobacillus sp. THM7-4]
MNRYAMYVEYDGKQTLPVDIRLPQQIIPASSLLNAIRTLALRNNFEVVSYDELQENDVRVFYRRSNLFGDEQEYIYYVRELTGIPEEEEET